MINYGNLYKLASLIYVILIYRGKPEKIKTIKMDSEALESHVKDDFFFSKFYSTFHCFLKMQNVAAVDSQILLYQASHCKH